MVDAPPDGAFREHLFKGPVFLLAPQTARGPRSSLQVETQWPQSAFCVLVFWSPRPRSLQYLASIIGQTKPVPRCPHLRAWLTSVLSHLHVCPICASTKSFIPSTRPRFKARRFALSKSLDLNAFPPTFSLNELLTGTQVSVEPKILFFFQKKKYHFKVPYGAHLKKRGLSVSPAASSLKLRSLGRWEASNQTGRR